jgi:hypothetical protein
MAKIVLTDVKVLINSVNLSDHITSVTIDSKTDVVDTTGFSSTAARTKQGGLKDNSVTIEFLQDFATSNVEQTIYPLLGTATTIVVSPLSTTNGIVGNPTYTFSALVSEWQPLKGGIGELATASVTWSIDGAVTKVAA